MLPSSVYRTLLVAASYPAALRSTAEVRNLTSSRRRGEEALERLAHDDRQPDVVLLDIMLPGMDGLRVCSAIREDRDLPIIMVTARGSSQDVIAGVEAGADDYVTKPVDAGELAARNELVFGPMKIRPAEGRVLRDDCEIGLTKTEFRLLWTLVAAGGARW